MFFRFLLFFFLIGSLHQIEAHPCNNPVIQKIYLKKCTHVVNKPFLKKTEHTNNLIKHLPALIKKLKASKAIRIGQQGVTVNQ